MVGVFLADQPPEPDKVKYLPPIPTIEIMFQAERRYRDASGPMTNYREVARALVDDLPWRVAIRPTRHTCQKLAHSSHLETPHKSKKPLNRRSSAMP